MSRVVHPNFEHSQRFLPRWPNILRRTISRYQLVELFVIIGAILLLWGGSSLGPVSSTLRNQTVRRAPATTTAKRTKAMRRAAMFMNDILQPTPHCRR